MSVSLNALCDDDDDGGGGGYGGDGDDTMSEPLNASRDAAPSCIALAPDRVLGGGPGLGALISIMGQLYSGGTGHEGSHRYDPAAYGRSSWRALILLVGALPQDGLHT